MKKSKEAKPFQEINGVPFYRGSDLESPGHGVEGIHAEVYEDQVVVVVSDEYDHAEMEGTCGADAFTLFAPDLRVLRFSVNKKHSYYIKRTGVPLAAEVYCTFTLHQDAEYGTRFVASGDLKMYLGTYSGRSMEWHPDHAWCLLPEKFRPIFCEALRLLGVADKIKDCGLLANCNTAFTLDLHGPVGSPHATS